MKMPVVFGLMIFYSIHRLCASNIHFFVQLQLIVFEVRRFVVQNEYVVFLVNVFLIKIKKIIRETN